MEENKFFIYLAQLRQQLSTVAELAEEKDINYGHLFKMQQGKAKANLTVYNGKAGLRHVWSGDAALQEKLQQAVQTVGTGAKSTVKGSSKVAAKGAVTSGIAGQCGPQGAGTGGQAGLWEQQGQWAGSDESGKGDFFGPLVVAAVVVDGSTASKLAAAGVRDCKLLTDKTILELEQVIKDCVIDFSVLELKPHIYNMRYQQVAAQGGKLNQLLGLGHVAALTQVLERQPLCRRALIDQFTPSDINLRQLKQRFPEGSFYQQPKAESDLAVAAASVLARARFLRSMEELSQRAGIGDLPKGGGAVTTDYARRLAQKLGREQLVQFVKTHFVNYQKL